MRIGHLFENGGVALDNLSFEVACYAVALFFIGDRIELCCELLEVVTRIDSIGIDRFDIAYEFAMSLDVANRAEGYDICQLHDVGCVARYGIHLFARNVSAPIARVGDTARGA